MLLWCFAYIVIFICKISTHLSRFGFILCINNMTATDVYCTYVIHVQIQYKQHNLRGRFQGIFYHTKWWGISPPAPWFAPPALYAVQLPHQCFALLRTDAWRRLLWVNNYWMNWYHNKLAFRIISSVSSSHFVIFMPSLISGPVTFIIYQLSSRCQWCPVSTALKGWARDVCTL